MLPTSTSILRVSAVTRVCNPNLLSVVLIPMQTRHVGWKHYGLWTKGLPFDHTVLSLNCAELMFLPRRFWGAGPSKDVPTGTTTEYRWVTRLVRVSD